MGYVLWSVVFGETPSAAKWNILGTNDASFNDGTGIAALAITSAKVSGLDKSLLTVDSNPYKFRAYRNAAYNSASGVSTRMPYDAESFDTNGNLAGPTYTVPISGFYQFNARYCTQAGSNINHISLYKNGASLAMGNSLMYTANIMGMVVSDIVQLAATDTIEVYYFINAVTAVDVGSANNYFSGFLVSRT